MAFISLTNLKKSYKGKQLELYKLKNSKYLCFGNKIIT